MKYVEEREFTLRFELVCEFPDDYEGEEDGYEWMKEFREIAPELLEAVARIVKRRPGWSVRPKNRGRPSD
jgi:hypothetical protein